MLRGFYTAASGMIAQQRHQEAISNNISNANTPGYKAEQATLRSFPEMLIQQMNEKQVPTERRLQLPIQQTIGGLNTGVYIQELVPDFEQGPVRETEMPTDLAIVNGTLPDKDGGLFFNVENEAGEDRYTRNGNFTVGGMGYLTTNQGHYVLDAEGNRIQPNTEDFTVALDGTIETDNMNATLGITYISNVNDLEKEGNDLLALEDGQEPGVYPEDGEPTFQVMQGALESSNVDAMKSMSEMMSTYRNFEQNQKVLRTYDESMGKAVNEIARLG